jgi:hypothetical protein
LSSSKPGLSLLEKISGPKAVPLIALVKKAEAAAERVQEGFGDFLELRIRELTEARYRLTGAPDGVWEQFYALVVDLRGSAAMVSRQRFCEERFGEVCRSLESLIKDHVRDSRSASVVASHVDALVLLASGRENEAAVRRLTGELAQAVARIPRKTGL